MSASSSFSSSSKAFKPKAGVTYEWRYKGDMSLETSVNTGYQEVVGGFKLGAINLPLSTMMEQIHRMDASTVMHMADQISVAVYTDNPTISFGSLIEHPSNLIGDILIVLSMPTGDVQKHIKVYREAYDENVSNRAEVRTRNERLLFLLCFHNIREGSFGQLDRASPKISSYCRKCLKLKDSDFKRVNVSSVENFYKLRVCNFVRMFEDLVPDMPRALKNRFLKGVGGHRITKIIEICEKECDRQHEGEIPFWRFFFGSRYVRQMSPFISFHPDHHANPFHNAMKRMYSEVCTYYRVSDEQLDKWKKGMKYIFLDGIIDSMKQKFYMNGQELPDSRKLLLAVAPKYSVQIMFENANLDDVIGFYRIFLQKANVRYPPRMDFIKDKI